MRRVLCFAVVFVLATGGLLAQGDSLFYHGRLLDAAGFPITRTVLLEFTICKGGDEYTPCEPATIVYRETQLKRPEDDGQFRHLIGTGTPELGSLSLGVLNTPESLFLEMRIDRGGSPEPLLPRKKLVLGQDFAFNTTHLLESVVAVSTRGIVATENSIFGGPIVAPAAVAGAGRISSVNNSVMGSDTEFTTQLSPGDTIAAQGQVKTIKYVYSPTSLIVDSSFSPPLQNMPYTFQKPILRLHESSGSPQFVFNSRGDSGIGTRILHHRLNVAGAIGFDNFNDRAPDTAATLAGARKTVGTSPTLLLNTNWVGAGLAVVSGHDLRTNSGFTDLVWVVSTSGGVVPVLQSSTTAGSPAARRYSLSGGFTLAMESGVYEVRVAMIGA